MSKTLQERVDYALNQLVEHIVPDHPEDDDAAAERRLDEAYQIVRDRLGRCDLHINFLPTESYQVLIY